MRHIVASIPAFFSPCQPPFLITRALKFPLYQSFSSRPIRFISTKLPSKTVRGLQYQWIEGVENMEKYEPGGYHPVRIGDILANRYRIVHKLGYGGYSTTWLARDLKYTTYIAIKIATADAAREVEIWQSLTNSNSHGDHPGRSMVPNLLDHFEVEGPNGCHSCYVTSPARSSVDAALPICFTLKTARVLVARLIMAVAYIHSRGVVHGDIHLGNVLLRLPSTFDQLSVDELYERFGEPEREKVIRFDGKSIPLEVPLYGILPVWLGKRAHLISSSEAHMMLNDFGESFSLATHQRTGKESHVPIMSRSPEAIFEPEKPLSFSSDVWSLSCAMWSIFGLSSLFESSFGTQNYIISQQIDMLGFSSFPSKWWGSWDARHERFDGSGQPKSGRYVRPSLEQLFEDEVRVLREQMKMDSFSQNETRDILDMFRRMLVFRPEKRMTMKSLMTSDWMLNWGLPELKDS